VREPPDAAVARGARAAAAPASRARLDDPTCQDRTIRLEPLPDDIEAQLV
jgi:hypothetical protein